MWSSTNELFQFYKRHCCQDNDIEPVSRTIFFKVFTEENISIYILKKDLCDTCVAYDTKNLSQEEYDVHQKMNREARKKRTRTRNLVQQYSQWTCKQFFCAQNRRLAQCITRLN